MKNFNCNLCGENNTKVIYSATIKEEAISTVGWACTNEGHGKYYQLVQCQKCSLYYSSPRPTQEDLDKSYSAVEDKVYQEEMEGRIKTFQRNLSHIAQYKQHGTLLDIGSSMGVFLSQAQKAGWSVSGIEPSEWCVSEGKGRFDLDLRQGTYKELAKFGKKFDVVTMWDVLEHVDDPMESLICCREALKEDGIFVFSTVDFGSWYAKLLGKKWPWLMKMHIYYFDKKTIKEYLRKAGLELLEIRTYRHTVSLNYLLFKLKAINQFLYQTLLLCKKTIFFNKNLYLTIGFGDFMEVYAKRSKDVK